jgi:8-oxo-dGTP pyrophosphatase MutT (NUDIX family)
MNYECGDSLKNAISEQLARFFIRTSSEGDLRAAAVAITIVDAGIGADIPGIDDPQSWSNEAALLLTRRSEKLRNHPGQWAFPGGRVEPGETINQAALREMHEEVGLDLSETAILGCLDDFVTRSGFVMTPVVVWAGACSQIDFNPDEVASVHRIPLAEFMREDAPKLDVVDSSEHPVLRMPVGLEAIATPTAALIYQFREVCLKGLDTRVAHFEQPQFAWK